MKGGLLFGGTSAGFVPNWSDTSVPSRDKLTTALIVETFQGFWRYGFLRHTLLYSLINLHHDRNHTNMFFLEN